MAKKYPVPELSGVLPYLAFAKAISIILPLHGAVIKNRIFMQRVQKKPITDMATLIDQFAILWEMDQIRN